MANFLSSFFGIIGSIIIVITSWLIIIRGYFSWSLYSPFNFLINLIKKKNEDRKIISTEKKTEKEKRLHTKDLIKKIEEINKSKNIDGLIVQLPLPHHIDENLINKFAPKVVEGVNKLKNWSENL